jgi:hypothetical protein
VAELIDDILSYQIFIFISKSLRHILDLSRSVLDYKGFSEIDVVSWRKLFMLIVLFANIGEEVIVPNIDRATLIKEIKHAFVESIKQFYDLYVISKAQFGNNAFEPLLLESTLLVNEHLLKVDLMNLFVRIVHAELFKAVMIEHFEPIYIQKLEVPHVFLFGIVYIQSSVQFLD